jgi:hypothetical protein
VQNYKHIIVNIVRFEVLTAVLESWRHDTGAGKLEAWRRVHCWMSHTCSLHTEGPLSARRFTSDASSTLSRYRALSRRTLISTSKHKESIFFTMNNYQQKMFKKCTDYLRHFFMPPCLPVCPHAQSLHEFLCWRVLLNISHHIQILVKFGTSGKLHEEFHGLSLSVTGLICECYVNIRTEDGCPL